jgi:hypothetical protein
MSQQNKTTLQSNINNALPNNTSGDITAADVRDNMISITDSLLFNSGSQTITGSLIITDGVEITGSVNVDGNIIATSFTGDGSGITGVTGEWDGSLNGNASITGSLVVTNGVEITGSVNVDGNIIATSFTGDGSGITGVTVADGSITNIKLVNDSVILGTTEVDLGTTSTTLAGLTLTGAIATGSFTGSFAGDGSALTGTTSVIADGSITNIKLVNDSVTLGSTEVNLGDTATTLAGLTLTGAIATGSFTGSFAGDGSSLTGITNTPFPYNGAAIITGSLFVTGSSPFINMDVISTTEGLNVYSTDSGTDFKASVLFNGFRAQSNANTYAKLSYQGIQYSESPTTFTKLNFQTGLSTQNIITVPKSVTGTMALTSNTVTIGTTAVNLITPSTTLAGLTDVKVTGSLLVTGSGVTVTGSINLDTNNTTTSYLNIGTSNNFVKTYYNGGGNLLSLVDFRSGYDQINTISTTEIDFLNDIPSNANANSLKVGSTLIAGSPAAIYFGMIQNQGLFSTRLVFDDASGVNTTSTLIIPTNTGDRTIALKDKGYLVANLPTGTLGDRAYVTDATSPTYLGTLTGGGAVNCPVFYNGSAWVSA